MTQAMAAGIKQIPQTQMRRVSRTPNLMNHPYAGPAIGKELSAEYLVLGAFDLIPFIAIGVQIIIIQIPCSQIRL